MAWARRVTTPLLVLTLLFAPLGLLAALLVFSRPGLATIRWTGNVWRRLATAHRPLALLTIGSAGLLAACLVLGLVDHRQVTGAPVWLKPGKFAAAVMTAGAAWPGSSARCAGPPRAGVRFAGTAMAVLTALELVLITIQAARGVASHFNFTSLFDGAVFTTMAVSITLFWFAELYLTVPRFSLPVRHARAHVGHPPGPGGCAARAAPPVTGWPNRRRSSGGAFRQGGATAVIGAHAVGVPDGGPGLPVTHWSTTGGDLRIPHFVGLHALQVLPLFALWVERRRRGQARPVWAAAILWLGLGAVTLVQALRGQPLLAPDAVHGGVCAGRGGGRAGRWPAAAAGTARSSTRRPPDRRPRILRGCTWTPAGCSRR